MSWIASFYACDGAGCQKVIAVRHDDLENEYEETWSDGVFYDFCPECAQKTENIALMEDLAKALNSNLETVTI